MGNLVRMPLSEVNATLERLERYGVTPSHLARARADEAYARRISEAIIRDGKENSRATISQAQARTVAGNNFWGSEEWSIFYSLTLTKRQLRAIEEIPLSLEELEAKGNHFLFLGLESISGSPLTVMHWRTLCVLAGHPQFAEDSGRGTWTVPTPWPTPWYQHELFANERTCRFGWYLMYLEVAPGSMKRFFDFQTQMLPEGYELPFAVEELTKNVLYFKKNGVYLNRGRWARCQDLAHDGSRVDVGSAGRLERRGFTLRTSGPRELNTYIGVGASRKF